MPYRLPRFLSHAILTVLTIEFCLVASVSAAVSTDYHLRLRNGDREVQPSQTGDFFRNAAASRFGVRGAIIQFYELPDEATRQGLEAVGVKLYDYLPDMAFFASIPPTVRESDIAWAGVRWVGTLTRDEKLAQVLLVAGTPSWSRDSSGMARFQVKVYNHITPDDAAVWLNTEYGAVILGKSTLANVVAVGLPAENWYDLAADERVRWIEPFWPRRELNNSNRVNVKAETVQAPPYSLDGTGAMVGEWDGGGVDGSHPDLVGRVQAGDASGVATHATHVAGIVLGSGAQSGGTYRGMAPGASMVSYKWFGSTTSLQNKYQDAISTYDIDISQNSWGVGYPPDNVDQCNAFMGNYFIECSALDDVVRGSLGKTVVISWSAGNERSTGSSYCGSLGFTWGTLLPYSTAKNVVAIGAINSNNSTMTGFSSWGPTDDGRLKPELVAPGCQTSDDWGVTSTKPGSGYTVMCGTSMSSPTASGCFALWLGRYKELYPGQVPLASTVKSAFIETADDLGDPGPEYDFGYGGINVAKAIDLLNDGAFFEDEITDGDTLTWTFAFDGTLPQLSFTLAWDDPGAAENANPTLINDLDLRMQSGGPFPVTYRPWLLNPASPANNAVNGDDHTNNVEQVRRGTGLFAPGTWTIMVIGYNVPSGPQKFSIAHTAGLVLTPGQAQYGVQLSAGADIGNTPGSLSLPFHVFNTGRQDDTYDLTLTSARGWTITPDPMAVTVAGRGDQVFSPVLSIPLGTSPGTVDTVVGVIVSQTDPAATDTDTLIVTVEAGYGVDVVAIGDTAGVPGRVISFDVAVTNLGTQSDVIDWSLADDAGWAIVPASGTVSLPLAGDTTFTVSATIPGAAVPGIVNNIVTTGVSQGDTSKTGQTTTHVNVIDFPPVPVAVLPGQGALINTATPELVWTHGAYSAPLPGFDVFTYAVEVGDDSAVTLGVSRYDALSDTAFVVLSPLADGAHFWRAVTYNAAGDSSGFSPSARFDVDTQRPAAPSLLTPPDAGFSSDSTPAFTWAPVTSVSRVAGGSVSYSWELSLDSLFASVTDSLTTTALSHQVGITHALPTCSTIVYWRVTATDPAGNVSNPSAPYSLVMFRRGDLNVDCEIDAIDVSAMIDYVFFNVAPPEPSKRGEVNCTAGVDAADLSYLVDHVFFNGPLPCGPE